MEACATASLSRQRVVALLAGASIHRMAYMRALRDLALRASVRDAKLDRIAKHFGPSCAEAQERERDVEIYLLFGLIPYSWCGRTSSY